MMSLSLGKSLSAPSLWCFSLICLYTVTCLLGVQTLGQAGAHNPKLRILEFRKGLSPTQLSLWPSLPLLCPHSGRSCLTRQVLPAWGPRITKHAGGWCGRHVSQPCHPHSCSLLLSVASGNPGNEMTQLPGECTCLREWCCDSEVQPGSSASACISGTDRKGVTPGQSGMGLRRAAQQCSVGKPSLQGGRSHDFA